MNPDSGNIEFHCTTFYRLCYNRLVSGCEININWKGESFNPDVSMDRKIC